MSIITGCLKKMSVVLADPVQYRLDLENESISLNARLGQRIQIHYTQTIYCMHCGRKTKQSFQQGYCFVCYRKLLACGLCLIHPEKCRYYEGICDPNDWAHAHCVQPQIVYLANSSGLKVGITRATHFQSRWIDQGATQGLRIFKTQNRYQAGILEVALKKYVADKTNWRTMLKENQSPLDLIAQRDQIFNRADADIKTELAKFPGEITPILDDTITQIDYPVLQYPTTIRVFNLDKDPSVTGILQGIKAQYLILDTGVISIRKFGGYCVEWHE